jgi:hypothetical protein
MADSAARPHNRADYGARFAGALTELATYVEDIRDLIDHDADPFASDMMFPPVFKVMHNLANQCGVRPLEEAYIYHLVLAAVSPEVESEEPVLAACGVAS